MPFIKKNVYGHLDTNFYVNGWEIFSKNDNTKTFLSKPDNGYFTTHWNDLKVSEINYYELNQTPSTKSACLSVVRVIFMVFIKLPFPILSHMVRAIQPKERHLRISSETPFFGKIYFGFWIMYESNVMMNIEIYKILIMTNK